MRKHGVVNVQNAALSTPQYLELGRAMGKVRPFCDTEYQHPNHQEIFVVSNTKKDGKKFGMDRVGYYWHSDSSFLRDPLPITMLYAQEVPNSGGETSFMDMAEAYEILPVELKFKLLGKAAVHEGKWKYIVTEKDLGKSLDELLRKDEQDFPAPVHPVTFAHPFSGRQCLYLTEGISNQILGMTSSEARHLVDSAWENIRKCCRVYTHKWKNGDIVLWDNRRMVHKASPSGDGSPRVMFRLGIEDGPFFMDGMLGKRIS